MTEYYLSKLQDGLEYQDLVVKALLGEGIVIQTTSSARYQRDIGESFTGVEIKYDSRFRETGNLYIETNEKTNATNEKWADSGVNREDNTWIYAIGDRRTVYLLSKNVLKQISGWIRDTKWAYDHGIRCVETETSKGFLMPVKSKIFRLALMKEVVVRA